MNGNHFIIWTERQGDTFRAIQGPDATRERYDEAVATRVLRVRKWDRDDERYDEYPLAFIAFGSIEDNHDFILDSSRDAAA